MTTRMYLLSMAYLLGLLAMIWWDAAQWLISVTRWDWERSMSENNPAPLSAAMLADRPFLEKTVENDGKTWRVASIHAEHPDKPWAWLVNHQKPAEQVHLSMRAECFQ